MKSLSELPAAGVTTVFTDIDDTLTREGKLQAATYAALESLQRAGMRVIPVTGRPAGWCDLVARQWPVDAVVGENGAFYMWHDQASHPLRTRHIHGAEQRALNTQRMASVRDHILREVPGCALASDQFCRLYDLAIDYCEDVPALPLAQIEAIARHMQQAGMQAKISAGRVNGWFGDYDKFSMSRLLMQERYGIDLAAAGQRERCVFVGDSPNDSPMFAFFPHSVGVANVLHFKGRLAHQPAYITRAEYGAGFVEVARHLLAER